MGPIGNQAPATTRTKAGATDAGRYRPGKVIGEGGMATVTEAEDTRLARTVAIKTMKPEVASSRDLCQRFVQEARILAALAHPGTVAVHDAGTMEHGELFYAMQRVHGDTLAVLMRSRSPAQLRDRASLLRFVDIFARVCQTMAYAHANHIIHRDLKPGNIMVDRFGAEFVMDWGIAKRMDTEEDQPTTTETQVGTVMGTPGYMSPEQTKALVEARDFQTDVFALGVILYEILTGRLPFQGKHQREVAREVLLHDPDPPLQINPRCGRELSAICMTALAKDPRRRYATAGELAEDIRRFREFMPVSAIRPRFIDHVDNWAQRNKVLASIVATLAIVGLIAGSAFGFHGYMQGRIMQYGFGLVEESRQETQRLQAKLTALRPGLGDTSLNEVERRQLEAQRNRIEGELANAMLEMHGRLSALVGFTYPRSDPRVLRMAREHTMQMNKKLLEMGRYAVARASLLSLIKKYEENNFIGFSPHEVDQLRDMLAEAEMKSRP